MPQGIQEGVLRAMVEGGAVWKYWSVGMLKYGLAIRLVGGYPGVSGTMPVGFKSLSL